MPKLGCAAINLVEPKDVEKTALADGFGRLASVDCAVQSHSTAIYYPATIHMTVGRASEKSSPVSPR
ncbi:hypothetical protein C1T17_09515 [Sphingobium sp. SCG-1]|nr:hypothetical protein C1T17_09515 [Sphingobium sp. SCG-1]